MSGISVPESNVSDKKHVCSTSHNGGLCLRSHFGTSYAKFDPPHHSYVEEEPLFEMGLPSIRHKAVLDLLSSMHVPLYVSPISSRPTLSEILPATQSR